MCFVFTAFIELELARENLRVAVSTGSVSVSAVGSGGRSAASPPNCFVFLFIELALETISDL